MRKLILIKRRSRLDGLVSRYNTISQAKFVIESQGQDFADYQREHDRYYRQLDIARSALSSMGILQEVDRDFLPNFIFGPDNVVIALGQDGLVANTLKYLDGQLLLGVNPDPQRWDGVLLPFLPEDLQTAVGAAMEGRRPVKRVTMAEAKLADGQELRAVNDLFIGQRTHVSYRYSIEHAGRRERQSSSGIIVSTGLGSTGWYRSLITGARAITHLEDREADPSFAWDAPFIRFTVREPFPSRHSGVEVVVGEISPETPLVIHSETPENGVIFSDGVEKDAIEFNSGAVAGISLSARVGNLVF